MVFLTSGQGQKDGIKYGFSLCLMNGSQVTWSSGLQGSVSEGTEKLSLWYFPQNLIFSKSLLAEMGQNTFTVGKRMTTFTPGLCSCIQSSMSSSKYLLSCLHSG